MATKDEMMCEYIIEEMKMEKNEDKMRKCYKELIKISKKFPPQKNENKFIYGKLGEKALIHIGYLLGSNLHLPILYLVILLDLCFQL
jgi:hypothetical protein